MSLLETFLQKFKTLTKTKKAIILLILIYTLLKFKKYLLKKRISNSKYQPKIVIIGAGFSGLCAAIRLKTELGYTNFTIYDKENDIGGTWQVNTYPGCECDVDGFSYSYSFEPKYDWSKAYPPQKETLAYLKNLFKKYDIYKHVKFNHEITKMEWNDITKKWRIDANNNGNYIRFNTDMVISGVGILNVPNIPNFKGLNSFKGKVVHSSTWDHNYNYNNKNIAVIGAGPSAIQIIPEMAKIAKHLYVFQRSASHCIGKFDIPMSKTRRWILKNVPLAGQTMRLVPYFIRELHWYPQIYKSSTKKPMQQYFEDWRDQTIKDDKLKEKITPTCEPFAKRILLHDDYYPCLNQKNVTLIKSGIEYIDKECIVYNEDDDDMERTTDKLDVIIMGTGFKSQQFLGSIKNGVIGKNGVNLQDQKWKIRNPNNDEMQDNAYAYKGVWVDDFPNLFILYGPGTNLGHASVVFMIECSMILTIKCIKHMILGEYNEVNVKKNIIDKYNKWLDAQHEKLSWTNTRNWYTNNTGRVPCNWGFSTPYFWWTCSKWNTDEFNWNKM